MVNDIKQRNVLDLFQRYETVTTRQIGDFFGYHQQTARALCRKWVEGGFTFLVFFCVSVV